MKFGLSTKDFQTIRNILKKFTDIKKMDIFGSRAMGNQKPGSDVDLVVYNKIPHDTLAQLKFQLEEEIPLPYHFDIILWDEIENDKLREHILQYGREFYKN